MKKWLYISIGILVVIMGITIVIQESTIKKRTKERNRYQQNTYTLLGEVEQYKVRDSLNAAKVNSLTLTVSEYEKYRAEDWAIIEKLRADKKRLERITNAQTQTITELQNIPIRDTIIYIDGKADTVRCMEYHDRWLDFVGCQSTDGTGTVNIASREELLCVEHVEYARFWGFLWRTKRVKSRQMNVVSKNPRTTVQGVEHVVIHK